MVLVRDGTYYEMITPCSGTAANPVIYKAYPGEHPVLDGSRSGSGPVAIARGGSYLAYDGLTFRNYSTVFDLRDSVGGIVITNCLVESSGYGVFAFTGDGLRIENTVFHNQGDNVIWGGGTNVHLYRVLIDHPLNTCIRMDDDRCDNVTMLSSEFANSPYYAVFVAGGNVQIQDTRIHEGRNIALFLRGQRNFVIHSSIWNTALAGGSQGMNLYIDVPSHSTILDSVITQSAGQGIWLTNRAHVYMRSSVVTNNVQDIVVARGASLDREQDLSVPGNRAPQFAALADQSVSERTPLSFTVAATDAEGDALTYAGTNLPPGASFVPATRLFSWTPADNQSGAYQVGFRVTDGKVTVSKAVKITVTAATNSAPVLTTIGDRSVNAGALLSFSTSATDPETDALVYSATGLPSGAGFVNRVFSWVPAANQAGTYAVIFGVSDGELTDAEKVTITVVSGSLQPPVIMGIATDTGTPGDGITSDPTLVISGTAAANSVVTLYVNGGAVGTTGANASGNWTYDRTSVSLADGTYTLTATATNAGGNTSALSAPYPVKIDTLAPTALSLSPASVAENQSIGTVVGTFTTTDPTPGDSHVYSLVAGSGSTDNDSFTLSGNQLRTAATFNYEMKASYSIRVRSTDAAGSFYEGNCTITITNVNEPPTALQLSNSSVAENQSAGATVGTFGTTDPEDGAFTYSLVAGTGSTDNSFFAITSNALQTADLFNYEARNSYSIRVRTTDGSGLSYERTFTITVTNVNEAPTTMQLSDRVRHQRGCLSGRSG